MNILIVEDEYSLADAISETLKNENFNVQIETRGLLLLFQIGITLQPVALHKNVYASVVEDMLLKVGACGQQRGYRGLKHHGASQAGHTGSQAALKKTRTEMDFFLIFKSIQL